MERASWAAASVGCGTLLVGLVLTACTLGSWVAWYFAPGVLEEEGLHEWLQAAVLLAAAFAHGRGSDWGRASAPGMLARSVLGLLCLTFALREMDIDTVGVREVWSQVESGIRAGGLLLWVVLLVVTVRRLRRSSLQAELFARPRTFHVLVMLGGLFMLAGWRFDKTLVPVDASISNLAEETLELCGYVLLLVAARVEPKIAST